VEEEERGIFVFSHGSEVIKGKIVFLGGFVESSSILFSQFVSRH